MNRVLFITAGIVIVIAIFLVWLFLFLNGAPTNSRDVFSDLGIVESSERPIEEFEDLNPDNVVLNLSDGKIQQITTAPIAGFGFASSTEGRNLLRYVERGTGYLFEINLNSGLQNQLSPSALPGTNEAYFSNDSKYLVVVTERSERNVTLVELPDNQETALEQRRLDSRAENIEFLDEKTLAYTINSFKETVGYVFNLEENTITERFRIQLPDATVFTSKNGNVYAYPKPTKFLEGALYKIVANTLEPVSQTGYGFIPFIESGVGFVNMLNDSKLNTYQLPDYNQVLFAMLPEKCTAAISGDLVWCASAGNNLDDDYVEDWYKGKIQSTDNLWTYNTQNRTVSQIFEPMSGAGREIDFTNLSVDEDNNRLFFINKIDSTLWFFNL